MRTTNSLIIGKGEIGKALWNILVEYYKVFTKDKEDYLGEFGDIDVMHICFPYSDEFIAAVKEYQGLYEPKFTIIHSTVPIGTSRKCGAIHSPIIGMHPNLEKSLKTFTKFLGGEQASEVADYFRKAGMKVYLFDEQETTEAMKLFDTECYRKDIKYTQYVKKQCQKYDIPFEAWSLWTENYNRGYQKLGYPEYTRPNLIPIMKEIGGHCLSPNSKLLEETFIPPEYE